MISHGQWVGRYPGKGDCLVEIRQGEGFLVATKLTDPDGISAHVPPGSDTWRINLANMQGWGFYAEEYGENLQACAARLAVVNRDTLRVYWEAGQIIGGRACNVVEFRRDGM